ncbi:MAG: hypothetical protein RML84_09140 [Anaerolineae bacterium]|nr:hypothetical protein [Anaerolineae bacterium]
MSMTEAEVMQSLGKRVAWQSEVLDDALLLSARVGGAWVKVSVPRRDGRLAASSPEPCASGSENEQVGKRFVIRNAAVFAHALAGLRKFSGSNKLVFAPLGEGESMFAAVDPSNVLYFRLPEQFEPLMVKPMFGVEKLLQLATSDIVVEAPRQASGFARLSFAVGEMRACIKVDRWDRDSARVLGDIVGEGRRAIADVALGDLVGALRGRNDRVLSCVVFHPQETSFVSSLVSVAGDVGEFDRVELRPLKLHVDAPFALGLRGDFVAKLLCAIGKPRDVVRVYAKSISGGYCAYVFEVGAAGLVTAQSLHLDKEIASRLESQGIDVKCERAACG